jgi:hypothetical protein
MTRTLSDVTYDDGTITSGKCSECGRVFTAPAVALAVFENSEWELVAAFGAHECTPAALKVCCIVVAASQQLTVRTLPSA